MTLNELSDDAKQAQQILYDNFQWGYGKCRYIVAILIGDLISALFALTNWTDKQDLFYKTLIFVGLTAVSYVLDEYSKENNLWFFVKLRLFTGYFGQMFLSGVLGNLQSLAYDVGTYNYLYLSIGMLFGMLFVLVSVSFLYLTVGESMVLQTDTKYNYARGLYKHPDVAMKQIKSSANRPI